MSAVVLQSRHTNGVNPHETLRHEGPASENSDNAISSAVAGGRHISAAELGFAAGKIYGKVVNLGTELLAKPGHIEVTVAQPLTSGMVVEVHRIFQGAGVMLDRLAVTDGSEPGKVRVSWQGHNGHVLHG